MSVGIFLCLLHYVTCTAEKATDGSFITCGSPCQYNSNCTAYLGNPCTFCDRGVCSPMCGVGCGSSNDCAGGGNPCTLCSSRRVCINPVPGCGTFCGNYDGACRFDSGVCGGFHEQCCTCHPTNMTKGCGNHTISAPSCGSHCTSSSDCVNAPSGCTLCVNNQCSQEQSICGSVCSGSGQCQSDPNCPQCVGYFCSAPASCGQVCISSGQCQSNPGNCKACIGTICSNYEPCGGSCGGDDWCNPSCPVCSFAKCKTSEEHELWLASATEEEIQKGIDLQNEIARKAEEDNKRRFLAKN